MSRICLESLSTFSAHVANLARIVEQATPHSLVVLDEIGVGTDPSEGASLAQAILEALADAGARVVVTTHFNLLKEMAAVDPRFANACVEFDPDTLAPTYRLRLGVAGVSSATTVAARMGLRSEVLERANALLERDDRRLDRMLSELASNRVALERERSEALRLRAESEAARAQYSAKLAKLEARREELFRRMREDLDQAFRGAHAEVAAVIRDLQRGGGAREAAHARERLKALEAKADEAAQAARGGEPETGAGGEPRQLARRQTRRRCPCPRRGRCGAGGSSRPTRTRVGPGRCSAPSRPDGSADRSEPAPRQDAAHEVVGATAGAGQSGGRAQGTRPGVRPKRPRSGRDLRAATCAACGWRRHSGDSSSASIALPSPGSGRCVVLHGLGSGALRDAVRAHLTSSPYVVSFARGDPQQGGDGVTVVQLEAVRTPRSVRTASATRAPETSALSMEGPTR